LSIKDPEAAGRVMGALKRGEASEPVPGTLEGWLEAENLVQHVFSREIPEDQRKKMGQFGTPPDLALFMARWVLRQEGPVTLLDPAVGPGVFVRAAFRCARDETGQSAPLRKITCYDIDEVSLDILRRLTLFPPGVEAEIRREDYLLADDGRYGAVLCNPPFIKYRRAPDYAPIMNRLERLCGLSLSGMSNTYVLFILKAALALQPGGRAAFITPSEFLNANFGRPVKEFLRGRNLLDGLIVFDHRARVFPSVLTTCCITLLRAGRPLGQPVRVVRVNGPAREEAGLFGHLLERFFLDTDSFVASADTDRSSATEASERDVMMTYLDPDELEPERKWAPPLPAGSQAALHQASAPHHRGERAKRLARCSVGQLGRCKRGIATGANRFFTLSASRAERLGIEPRYLLPCLVKAQNAPLWTFAECDWERLRGEDARVFLLNAGDEPSPAVKSYLKQGEESGVHRRYLTERRTPWYQLERRSPAQVLVTTFARRGFRFVENRCRAYNLTAFHCFYPAQGLGEAEVRALLALLLSEPGRRAVRQHARVYGKGLMKLEPNDVESIVVPDIRYLPAARVEELASLFLEADCVWRELEAPATDNLFSAGKPGLRLRELAGAVWGG